MAGSGFERGESEIVDKLVSVNRVAKVVKGGRRFGFRRAGRRRRRQGPGRLGHGKAREVPEAIRKATEAAKRGMIRVPLREGRTLHHDATGRYSAGRVVLRAAPAGTGIIAGGPMRAVFETLGVQDVVAKSVGTSNPYNMVKATFAALSQAMSPRSVAARRGRSVAEVLRRGGRERNPRRRCACPRAELRTWRGECMTWSAGRLRPYLSRPGRRSVAGGASCMIQELPHLLLSAPARHGRRKDV